MSTGDRPLHVRVRRVDGTGGAEMSARLALVRDHHPCRPAATCAHDSMWTCPHCGQGWIRAGTHAWVPADWLTYPRAILDEEDR